jgi:methanethiol S-methyltransferase
MGRIAVLLYGVITYLFFFVSFVYFFDFAHGLIVPKAINDGPETPMGTAMLIDIGLIALFGIQHTIMARPAFKEKWTKIIPPAAERSTFVLVTTLLLVLLMWQWRPMPETIYDLTGNPGANYGLIALSGLGFGLILLSSFLINHFDLFGLRQVWLYFRGTEYTEVPFAMPVLYRWVRHPLMLGVVIFIWATPHMTQGHLLFAGAFTVYIVIGVHIEERDLAANLGVDYETYRRATPMLIPRPPRQASTES